jgi:hypothetical protein
MRAAVYPARLGKLALAMKREETDTPASKTSLEATTTGRWADEL